MKKNLNILVYGGGAVGSYFAGMMSHNGQNVTLVTRGDHLKKIKKQGLEVNSHWGKFSQDIPVLDLIPNKIFDKIDFRLPNINYTNNGGNLLLVIGGALALTAMLLPGISGALVLVTLGQYTVVANAVHDSEFNIILYFLLGGLVGLFTFVPFMNFMLLNYKEDVMSALTGLMLGSLATLWPWKESYDSKGVSPNLGISQVFDSFDLISIIGTICFGFLGFGLYL